MDAFMIAIRAAIVQYVTVTEDPLTGDLFGERTITMPPARYPRISKGHLRSVIIRG